MTREMILILSTFQTWMATFQLVHRMEHIYLNSSDLQEYATKLKILMIQILLFLEKFKAGFSLS